MIMYVMDIIERFKKKQADRINHYDNTRMTRGKRQLDLNNNQEGGGKPADMQDYLAPMKHFCLAMDNYFSLPRAIKKLRDIGVGVVGTARFRKGWPPECLRKIDASKVNFNDFYYCTDEHGTLVGRWMDNGLVFCVSTLHKVGNKIRRLRRRPRLTEKNKNHVREIWGKEGTKEIEIPTIIDDYNHWMGGVDLADQRIAYYQPDMRCRRNWIPMFVQVLSIIRSNSYVVYKSCSQMKAMSHKQFTLEMIATLMANAKEEYKKACLPRQNQTQGRKRRATDQPGTGKKTPKYQRRRIARSQVNAPVHDKDSFFSVFNARKVSPSELHNRVISARRTKPGVCVYCAYLFAKEKEAGNKLNYDRSVKRTAMVCEYCTTHSSTNTKCFLCKDHFKIFHET